MPYLAVNRTLINSFTPKWNGRQHWFKNWGDTMLAPGHYLNQSYLAVNRTRHLSSDTQAKWPILCKRHLKCISVSKSLCTSTNISLKYDPEGIIGKKSALDELMARCLTGDKRDLLLMDKLINSLTPEQTGQHFAHSISNEFSWMKTLTFNWSTFFRV